MMRWGTFEKGNGEVHICPVENQHLTWPMEPHVIRPECECRPTPDQTSGRIWLHHDGH
jgi:hypothetical protein